MDEFTFRRNEHLASTVIKGLQSRNMTGYYAKDKKEALEVALRLIPEGSKVSMGGGLSVHEIGLPKALREGNYTFVDWIEAEDKRAAMLFSYDADYYLSSANAITNDGILLNIDGNANRVSAIAQGPRKVLFIVGMNKVCADIDAAMKRARNVAATANANHYCEATPCTETGACLDCKAPDNVCCQFLMTRYSNHAGRIHVILVNDHLGF